MRGRGEEGEDSLAALVSAVQKRKMGPDEAMLARVEAEADRMMDNGVRINPSVSGEGEAR